MATRRKRRAEETSLSKAIQQALTAKGCKVIRVQSGILPVKKGDATHFVHTAPAGTPDLLVIRPTANITYQAAHTWLEVKTKTGKPSKEQLEWHAWAKESGVRVATVRSISEAIAAVF